MEREAREDRDQRRLNGGAARGLSRKSRQNLGMQKMSTRSKHTAEQRHSADEAKN